jgi:hypothetical protein
MIAAGFFKYTEAKHSPRPWLTTEYATLFSSARRSVKDFVTIQAYTLQNRTDPAAGNPSRASHP